MFISDQVNREGIFGVIVYQNGEKREVLIDNYFPCRSQKPVFSRANGKELWVLILEKVWAKINGSYERIIHGHSYTVFRDLLGAPSFYHKTNQDNIWEIIKTAFDSKHIICATSFPEKKD